MTDKLSQRDEFQILEVTPWIGQLLTFGKGNPLRVR